MANQKLADTIILRAGDSLIYERPLVTKIKFSINKEKLFI